MNYERIYNEFISDRLANPPAEGVYVEKHHIVPRSMGGSDDADNLIALEAYDHFLAHYYLAKIHDSQDAWLAVNAMLNMKGSSKRRDIDELNIDPVMYADARKNMAKAMSEKAKKQHAPGGSLENAYTAETNAKRSASMKGKNEAWYDSRVAGIQSGVEKGNYSRGAKKMWSAMNEESKQGYSDRMKERNAINNPAQTEEGRAKIKSFASSPEEKAKRSARAKGASNPMARAVVCLDTGEVFATAVEAGAAKGVKSHGNINKVCKGVANKAGGFRWAYA